MTPLLVQMPGAPGSGKSALARVGTSRPPSDCVANVLRFPQADAIR